jgi:hypothetical protein
MPKAARERVASPPAGTAPSPAHQSLPALVRRIMGEVGLYVTKTVTDVNRGGDGLLDHLVGARHQCRRDRNA